VLQVSLLFFSFCTLVFNFVLLLVCWGFILSVFYADMPQSPRRGGFLLLAKRNSLSVVVHWWRVHSPP
jgi:hypothetical protein